MAMSQQEIRNFRRFLCDRLIDLHHSENAATAEAAQPRTSIGAMQIALNHTTVKRQTIVAEKRTVTRALDDNDSPPKRRRIMGKHPPITP